MPTRPYSSHVPDFTNNPFVQWVIQEFENADDPSDLPSSNLAQLQSDYRTSVASLLSHEIDESPRGSGTLVSLMDAVHISALLLSKVWQDVYIKSLLGPDISRDGTKTYSRWVAQHLANHAIQSAISKSPGHERKAHTIEKNPRVVCGSRRGW